MPHTAFVEKSPVSATGFSIPVLKRGVLRALAVACACLAVVRCGSTGTTPTMATTPPTTTATTVPISGAVTDRLTGAPIGPATITFKGLLGNGNAPGTVSAPVTSGQYQIALLPGNYVVTIAGASNVTHETASVPVSTAGSYPFSVLSWGAGLFGATIDQTFEEYFDQLARVAPNEPEALRKWVIPPTELYLVTGTVPDEQFAMFSSVLSEINNESVSALWCGLVGTLRITTGPDISTPNSGQIVVRPNWDTEGDATVGPTQIRSGTINMNVFGPVDNSLLTHDELKAGLAHELFHVAFAFHVCGGDLGSNPFGFSRQNCPYPDSLMANLGTPGFPLGPSPQDKLAACIVYSPDTHPGNRYADTNPTYQ